MSKDTAKRIRSLNDAFRSTLQGGRVLLTAGVHELPESIRGEAINAMRTFTSFDEGNDPHGEHDFGKLEIEGYEFFWKIDYFDKSMAYGSENPADPERTVRVLTLMLTE